MALKSNAIANNPIKKSLFLTCILLSILSLFFLVFFYTSSTTTQNQLSSIQVASPYHPNSIKVHVADLPRSLNYGLLEKYWSSGHPDSRIPSDPDRQIPSSHLPEPTKYPPYPENPLIKQYSAEYWILGDLETPEEMRTGSFAKRVFDVKEADVVFVPFFATLSAEMQLGSGNGAFRKKEGNEDYLRQKEVVDFVKNTDAWKRSGGRDHVFVLTGGLVREKLWDLLVSERGIIMEEGFPNATGREQSIKGMRTSEFCLHPAGDTPTSCRLFDAIQSLCIPVIVSDNIELPFEGMIDYSEFSVFVAVSDALTPNWLVTHLRSIPAEHRDEFRRNMVKVQPIFEYESGHPGGVGPIPLDGAVNHIWKKVHQKLPAIKEAIVRDKRKPAGVSIALRCHCT